MTEETKTRMAMAIWMAIWMAILFLLPLNLTAQNDSSKTIEIDTVLISPLIKKEIAELVELQAQINQRWGDILKSHGIKPEEFLAISKDQKYFVKRKRK